MPSILSLVLCGVFCAFCVFRRISGVAALPWLAVVNAVASFAVVVAALVVAAETSDALAGRLALAAIGLATAAGICGFCVAQRLIAGEKTAGVET